MARQAQTIAGARTAGVENSNAEAIQGSVDAAIAIDERKGIEAGDRVDARCADRSTDMHVENPLPPLDRMEIAVVSSTESYVEPLGIVDDIGDDEWLEYRPEPITRIQMLNP